ncbi:hypothetical protein MIR68_003491 [Amoeboaphelidium protococcarum]|nr:hypothetical protein MIR68_003491 [Amoeboaphelidium protococcarum]
MDLYISSDGQVSICAHQDTSASSLSSSSAAAAQSDVLTISATESDLQFKLEQIHDDFAPLTSSKYVVEERIVCIAGFVHLGFASLIFYITEAQHICQSPLNMTVGASNATSASLSIQRCVKAGSQTIHKQQFLTLSQEQLLHETVQNVISILESGQIYFSDDYDLTRSIQVQLSQQNQHNEDLYWWNRFLQIPLTQAIKDNPQFTQFQRKLICGYVNCIPVQDQQNSSSTSNSNNRFQSVYLISRMSRKRAGTRYTRRGIDLNGYCAMMAETEVILVKQLSSQFMEMSSFVMLRGSVPWIWHHEVDLSYKPPLIVRQQDDLTVQAMKKSFQMVQNEYPDVRVINLLNTSGYEAQLRRVFSDAMSKHLPDVHHHAIDINSSSFQMKDLLENLRHSAGDEGSIFSVRVPVSSGGSRMRRRSQTNSCNGSIAVQGPSQVQQLPNLKVNKIQRSIFRLNCLDCLDRTNMVMFVVASYLLSAEIGGADHVHSIRDLEYNLNSHFGGDFIQKWRNIWIANGNALALQYTGTGTLHCSFIRQPLTGWSILGLLMNLLTLGLYGKLRPKLLTMFKMLSRYYMNNIADSYRQDALDQFLGYHRGSGGADDVQDLYSPSLYSLRQQSLQRRQSLRVLKSNVYHRANQIQRSMSLSSIVSLCLYVPCWIAVTVTTLFGLFLRHFAPRQLCSLYDYIGATVILIMLSIWRLFVLPFVIFGQPNQQSHQSQESRQQSSSSSSSSSQLERLFRWRWSQPRSGNTAWEGDDFIINP